MVKLKVFYKRKRKVIEKIIEVEGKDVSRRGPGRILGINNGGYRYEIVGKVS